MEASEQEELKPEVVCRLGRMITPSEPRVARKNYQLHENVRRRSVCRCIGPRNRNN